MLSMWVAFSPVLAVASVVCLVQSDNRDDAMTRTSFAQAAELHFEHKVYNCFAKGANKPAIILHACGACDVVLWLDSDILVKYSLTPQVVLGLLRRVDEGVLVTGVDFYRTIKKVRSDPQFPYTKWFNNGAFVVNCSTTSDILDQWLHYVKAENFADDQQAMQIMADENSIFHRRIQYDFKVFGVHSAYMKHFAGGTRRKFPLKNFLTSRVKIEPCPLQ